MNKLNELKQHKNKPSLLVFDVSLFPYRPTIIHPHKKLMFQFNMLVKRPLWTILFSTSLYRTL